jgi:hypothetical protein
VATCDASLYFFNASLCMHATAAMSTLHSFMHHLAQTSCTTVVVDLQRPTSVRSLQAWRIAGTSATPDNIMQDVVLNCTSTVIVSHWGKAVARAWFDSDCVNNAPAQCSACCVDGSGEHIPGCDCDAWTASCSEIVTTNTKAMAQAWITQDVETNTATCTKTVSETVDGITETVNTTEPTVLSCCLSMVHVASLALHIAKCCCVRWGRHVGVAWSDAFAW